MLAGRAYNHGCQSYATVLTNLTYRRPGRLSAAMRNRHCGPQAFCVMVSSGSGFDLLPAWPHTREANVKIQSFTDSNIF